jgi:hypothetical protein
MVTDINNEDRLVQDTFAEHLEKELGWENVYAWNQETFGSNGVHLLQGALDGALGSALCLVDILIARLCSPNEKVQVSPFTVRYAMKTMQLLLLLTLLAIAGCVATTPAEIHAGPGKNLCLLAGENCPDRKDSINEIIAKLKAEISKGTAIYTPAELRILQLKLDDYELMLYNLLYSPSN